MDTTLAEIRLFAGAFAPVNWAFCHGQLLSISQYMALFSLLGTTYGGNGQTNFALPDLRGRSPVCPGMGPGLSGYYLGEKVGVERVTLTSNQMPTHEHSLSLQQPGSNLAGDKSFGSQTNVYASIPGVQAYSSVPTASMASESVEFSAAGNGLAHENRPASLGLNFIICISGMYPVRP